MKFKFKKFIVFLVIFLVLFIAACDGVTDSGLSQEDKMKTIVSSDNKSSILVPNNWSEDYILNDQAEINVGFPLKEQYAIVLTESADSFTDDMTLEDYYNLIISGMEVTINNSVFSEPTRAKIDNKSALIYEVHGEVEKVKVSYLIAIVEGDSNYYQILTWTIQNRFEDFKDLYMNVIESFKANEGSTSSKKYNSTSNNDNVSTNEIISTDGKIQLTATEEWIEPQELLSSDAILSIMTKSEDMFFIIIPDSKEYFSDDTSLSDYYSIVLNNMSSSVNNYYASDPLDNILNGYKSLKFEISGDITKIKIVYLVTLIETEDCFYQVIGWASESYFQEHKEQLNNIVDSFKIVK